jgi:hypothetical protein
MKFRNLDSEGQWTFGKGKANYVKDSEAVGLNIKTRIKEWVNDCFFNLKAGIDWYNRLGSFNQKDLLDADIKRIIIQTQDVAQLKSFTSTVTDRAYRAEYTVLTTFSQEYQDLIEQNI